MYPPCGVNRGALMAKCLLKRYIFAALIVLLSLPCLSFSEEAAQLSLDGAISEALKSNPEILAAERSYEAANSRIWQSASLNDPMLEFEYDRMTADRMLSGDPMRTYAISQDIPLPTKLYLRAKISAKLAKMAYEDYKAKEREIVSEIKSAYSELFLIYKTIDIVKEGKAVLEQVSGSATARYSAGQGSHGDALKAQVEIARAENELIMLEQKRLTSQARLNILMNKDPETELGMPMAESPVLPLRPLAEFYQTAKNSNPELKAYKYAIEKGKAAYGLSFNEFIPDVTIKFKQMMNGDHEWAGMLGATVPLWFLEKQAFGVKEMKKELEMLEAEYTAAEKKVLFDIRDAYARADANKKLIALYETAFIPQADEAMKASIKGYEAEKADLFYVLDSQRTLLDFKIEHYKAILELRIAMADLEKYAGGTDEKK